MVSNEGTNCHKSKALDNAGHLVYHPAVLGDACHIHYIIAKQAVTYWIVKNACVTMTVT